ncbi:MAG: peptidoglycan binding domain-containing protein [Chloroflexi bacterium]|nr:peptidoglycan binding domain-containing protein [Chloroflexota bacterium]
MHRADQTPPDYQETRPTRHGRGRLTTALVIGSLLMLGAISLLAVRTVQEAVLVPYETSIYPNVYVLDVDLGGLTPDEASERLTEAFGHYDAGSLTLSDGERTWTAPWSEAGLRLDVDATIQTAFAVGRANQGLEKLLNILEMREGRYEVIPAFAVDPDKARGVLEQLAPEVSVPPTDATLSLEGDQLIAVPGQPGRVLDIDATLDNIVATVTHLGPDNQFAMTFQIVPPQLADTKPAQAQAEEMLNRQVVISTYDWLTDETFSWALDRETLATWLRLEQAEDGSGPTIRVAEEAVQATLESLAAQLGEGRGLRLEGATQRVLGVFDAGGGTVELGLTHPLRTCVVQSGDDLTVIAARFGVPPGLIAEVNPGVDLDWLYIGQELTIPSEDVLKPYPPVPGKQIIISIAQQRLRVYENGALLYDWPVSTGVASSPTYTGEFQVLNKSENAYASQWDLWMPHFIAVYRAGGDTYNGIHALPILSSGQRLWEGALGSPASFGCIILGIQEAETLYNWAEIGVLVTIE